MNIDKKLSIFINGQLVAAPCEPERMWLGISMDSETQPEGCGYLENNCPEGAINPIIPPL